MVKIALPISKKDKGRSCGDCTKCCEGWLVATIHGEEMSPGKPCQFVDPGVGCKIYKNRPKDPCKMFSCMWKAVEDVPEEFQPSKSGIILHYQEVDGIKFLNASEAGNEISSLMLSWFVSYCVANQVNAHWTADGKDFWMGRPDFNEAMNRRYFS